MQSIFEPIGQHIRLVDERNDVSSTPILLGVSIEKVFIPSVANIIGSNMATYKVIKRGQFACSLMQVRRDKKMPVALLKNYDEAIVSPAYPVFEVVDEKRLLPEYLMMWMLRSEFDREACFYAVGGVRGSLEWADFCNMLLPIPSIEKQREILKEYETVVNRIRLNERLSTKLEETAQAIYKHWFVDFEFPMSAEYAQLIGKLELEGQPYKSSGGEMEYNDVLEQEIPKSWDAGCVASLAKKIVCGKTPPTANLANYGSNVPFVTIPDMHRKVYVIQTKRSLSQEGAITQPNQTLPANAVCVSCIASPGLVVLTSTVSQTNQQINSVVCNKKTSCFYAYFSLLDLGQKIKEWGIKGSVGLNMSKSEFSAMKILNAPTNTQTLFHCLVAPLFERMLLTQKQQHLMEDFLVLLNTRMAVTEV